MLAERRLITSQGGDQYETPRLIPSFSSKGFHNEVSTILRHLREQIQESALVSLYDIYYGQIPKENYFPEVLVYDSGGYEAAADKDLTEYGRHRGKGKPWTHPIYREALSQIRFPDHLLSIVVSFDTPVRPRPLDEQIARGISDARTIESPNVAHTLLIKPNPGPIEQFVSIDRVIENLDDIAWFNIIGVTEKELGYSILRRMENIARLRRALQDRGLSTPIHVFGALDPISTVLYFISGADIFDGLTWLRYAFLDNHDIAAYVPNVTALDDAIQDSDDQSWSNAWGCNLRYLRRRERAMRTFCDQRDYDVFNNSAQCIRDAIRHFQAEFGEV